MLSLGQLQSAHSTLLVLDAASAEIQVGLLRRGTNAVWQTSQQEAGAGLFLNTERVLNQSALSLAQIDAFIFCEGPGSVLGIRTSAAAIRTWQVLRSRPIYTFNSLILVSTFQRQVKHCNVGVVADARRDSWHYVAPQPSPENLTVQRVSAKQLQEPICTPVNFRQWASLDLALTTVPYSVAEMFSALPDENIFRAIEEPDAFSHETPSYQTWSPHVHRAPI